jgi:glycosyltransferase involved in cell wall biosynthesis
MFSVHIDTARTWRGGQNQLLLAARGLRARGHKVALVVHPDGELRARLGADGEAIALAPRSEVDLPAAWRLSRILRDLAPDVVHAHDSHAVAMAALALSFGAPVPRPPLVFARRVDFRLRGNSFSKWKYRQVDAFVAASTAIRSMLVEDGAPADRVFTVHDGIDIDRVDRAEPLNVREEFWFPPHSAVIGNIAALVPHKGQKYLIDAAATVVQQAPEARFLVLGEGELRGALEQQVHRLHLGQHVILAGFRPEVLGVLKGLDLFVMSSVTEGLGSALLDAMAAERPIVATRAGGIPEVVVDGESGVLVPPRDAPALSDAILALLRDDARRARLAAAGRARVCDFFSADRMIDETLAVYARLAGRTPAAGTARP